jgi:hypothetical protein
MDKEKLMDLTGNGLVLILAVITSAALLYGYMHASPEDQKLIFWFTITQPQE